MNHGELGDPGTVHWVANNCNARHLRCDLFEQFKPFSAQAVFELGESSGVATRARHAFDVSGPHRINGLHEHDRYRTSRLLYRPNRDAAGSEDAYRAERNQFLCMLAKTLNVTTGPACFDTYVTAVGPAQFLQAFLERCNS